jgi:hypothetical protein
MKKQAKRHWYTVILLYPDFLTDDFGADIYVNWCMGKTPEDAAAACQEKAARAQNDGSSTDIIDDPTVFRVIAVIEGKREIWDASNF